MFWGIYLPFNEELIAEEADGGEMYEMRQRSQAGVERGTLQLCGIRCNL